MKKALIMKRALVFLLAICCCAILFACQKPCEHQYQEAITTEAGCTAVGVKTFTCTLCQDSYTEQIAAIGHNFGGASITKKATCIEEGEKTHTCTRCGITEVVETLPMSNHKYSSKTTASPTCVAEGVKTYTCSVCEDSYTEPIAKTKHSYTSKVTTAATCTTDGEKTYTCSHCNDSYTESIAKGHSYTSKVTTAATCTEEGVKTYTCSSCGDSYKETIFATGHKWVNATCTKAKTCSNCGITSGDALGHNFISGKNCSRCGAEPSATFELPSTPKKISYIASSGKVYSSCEVTKITYSLKQSNSDGLEYVFTFEGKCTYNRDGDNKSDGMLIAYKLYDSDGVVVASGLVVTEEVAVGEKFKDSIAIYWLTPGETYKLVIFDYAL